MKWIIFGERKPAKSGFYYWKGKNGYGGHSWFNIISKKFKFEDDVPIDIVYCASFCWLEEDNESAGVPADKHLHI
jgi:hypothetical protein